MACKNEDSIILSSENSGFLNESDCSFIIKENTVYVMGLEDVGRFERSSFALDTTELDNIENSITPYPYPHWTIKEIHEQSNTIRSELGFGKRIINDEKVVFQGLKQYKKKILKCKNIILIGCGSSHYASLVGKHFMEKLEISKKITAIDAGDFEESIIDKKVKTLAIYISQSGETKDVHKCLETCKKYKNIINFGIVNVRNSLISRDTDCGIHTVLEEKLVASTKSFTSQVLNMVLFSLWFSQYKNKNLIFNQKRNY